MKSRFDILQFSLAASLTTILFAASASLWSDFPSLAVSQTAQVVGAGSINADPVKRADALLKLLDDLQKKVDTIGLDLDASATEGQVEVSGTGDYTGKAGAAFYKTDANYPSFFEALDQTILVRNKGRRPVAFSSIQGLVGAFSFKGGSFPGTGGTCTITITSTCTLVISFEPKKGQGAASGDALYYESPPLKLAYASGSKNLESNSFKFLGFALKPAEVSVTSDSVEAAPILAGDERELTISLKTENGGPTTADKSPFRDVTVSGLTAPFSLRKNNCSGLSISCSVVIVYKPASAGVHESDIELRWNNGADIQKKTVHLKAETIAFSGPADEVLVVYNASSPESVDLKNYYLANRPEFSKANTIGITHIPAEECAGDAPCLSGEVMHKYWFKERIANPVAEWLKSHPEKHIRVMILTRGLPNRFMNETVLEDGMMGSIQYDLSKRFDVLATSLDMGSVEATKRYIDKLKAMYARMLRPGAIISAQGTGKEGDTYYFDDTQDRFTFANLGAVAPVAKENADEVLSHNSAARVRYRALKQSPFTEAQDVLGYVTWGYWGQWDGEYPVNGVIRFSGNSGWYLINTLESHNGQWVHGDTAGHIHYQGNFIKWFSKNAFGGNNYENTPVGAVTTPTEPGVSGKNSPKFFSCWDAGRPFVYCAWASRETIYFQAVGDPWVAK